MHSREGRVTKLSCKLAVEISFCIADAVKHLQRIQMDGNRNQIGISDAADASHLVPPNAYGRCKPLNFEGMTYGFGFEDSVK